MPRIKKDIAFNGNVIKSKNDDCLKLDMCESCDSNVVEKNYIDVDCENKNIECSDDQIDAIFELADQKMLQDQQSVKSNGLKEKTKKAFLKTFIVFSLITSVIFIGLVILAYREATVFLPQLKSNFLSQYTDIQNELINIDDSSLTVDELYQKKFLLLLSPEDLEEILSLKGNFKEIIADIQDDGEISTSIIPEEKLEEYEQLVKEYEDVLAELYEQENIEEPNTESPIDEAMYNEEAEDIENEKVEESAQ